MFKVFRHWRPRHGDADGKLFEFMPQCLDARAVGFHLGGIINGIINVIIAYFIFRSQKMITLGGAEGFGVDFAATAFILSFIIGMIGVAIHRRRVRKGALPHVPLDEGSILAKFPTNVVLAGLLFGLAGFILWAPPTLILLYVIGLTEMSPTTYAVFKGILMGLLSFWLIPHLILFALGTAEKE